MSNIFNIVQIVIAALLIVVVLMQQKGSGLGAAFGGGDGAIQTRRGPEKILFNVTIVLGILFLGTAVARLFLV